MTQDIFTLLSVAAPFALIICLWVMAQISHRFGEVTHRPPLYRGFYVAITLFSISLGVRLLALRLSEAQTNDLGGNTGGALLYDGPIAVGITLSVFIAWRYWGWLVYAREDQTAAAPRPSHPTKQ